jgi:hypothetical protein
MDEDFKKLSQKERLKAFALAFKDDPDFHKLPFPDDVLAELGIKRPERYISAVEATNRCFNMVNTERYTTNVVEVIDQTSLPISFPPFPQSVPPTNTNETKTQELEDCSSVPSSGVVQCSVASS